MGDERRSRFETAYIASSYLLGARGDALVLPEAGAEASLLARALGSSEKETRALALAREIARIAIALDEGGFR